MTNYHVMEPQPYIFEGGLIDLHSEQHEEYARPPSKEESEERGQIEGRPDISSKVDIKIE